MDYRKFVEITRDLPLTMASDHFEIRYGLRNPRRGKGLGPAGVGDAVIIRWYLSALERLYRTMTSPPWNRPAPTLGASGKTQVYVCDLDQVGVGDPFTTADRDRVPFIALSCRSSEPLTDGAMRRAAAEAIHEATHVFNSTERPFHRRMDFHWWAWFNEALATFMESRILPGNQDYFRFLANWIDQPGVPLNDWRAAYQGCLFLHYLAGRVNHGLPNQIWTEAAFDEKPLQAITRLVSASGYRFSDSDPDQHDLFAHGYAMDSYFLRDHASSCFAPELCSRFGDRAVAASFELTRGETTTTSERLPHLATHYFRCFLRRSTDAVRFSLRAMLRDGVIPFKAEVAVVQTDMSRGKREVLRPIQLAEWTDTSSLTLELGELAQIDELHHLVLVVSNCATQDLPMNNTLSPGDFYQIDVSAS